MTKNNIMKTIKEYFIVTIGVILVAFGLQYFYSPNDIAGGGLSGLSLVINHYVPSLSLGTLIFLGNLILFAIAFLLIGGDFGAKTIYASFALSFVMDFMEKVMHSHALTNNLLLAVICGTLIIGTGLALAFSINASTGGTDILAKILNKYTSFNIGRALLIVDLSVVICGAITFGLNKGLYSLLAVVINGLLVDKVIDMIGKYKEQKAAEQSDKEEIAA
ncbi:YitT family protein [Intestinibacter bartlettii]|uniref:YitT family protein n=1 Tax=Intestinibacter bartlettii TaxID=261299 RepID=A0ABS6DVI9_9FIRM|nr:YitT family protein [Intestinibacter bartlettii]MBU5335764.1 YitT family protein [Intestinibacter bartlettii]